MNIYFWREKKTQNTPIIDNENEITNTNANITFLFNLTCVFQCDFYLFAFAYNFTISNKKRNICWRHLDIELLQCNCLTKMHCMAEWETRILSQTIILQYATSSKDWVNLSKSRQKALSSNEWLVFFVFLCAVL